MNSKLVGLACYLRIDILRRPRGGRVAIFEDVHGSAKVSRGEKSPKKAVVTVSIQEDRGSCESLTGQGFGYEKGDEGAIWAPSGREKEGPQEGDGKKNLGPENGGKKRRREEA